MLKNEFHKHNSEWKKPDTEYILYNSISMKFTKKEKWKDIGSKRSFSDFIKLFYIPPFKKWSLILFPLSVGWT